MSLLYISQQLIIYIGSILIIIGIIGNGMNILIFSSVRNYRTTPSSFYFLISAIVNIFFVVIALTGRIIQIVYLVDLPYYTTIWCKIRNCTSFALSFISMSYACLASIDQFLVTSHNVRLRRYSNIKWSHRISFIITIVWFLYSIPACLYANATVSGNMCGYNNGIYQIYAPIAVILFQFTIPISIMIIFGYLTYRNISQTIVLVEQGADRQLVRMTLMQTILIFISIVPYGIQLIYNAITLRMIKSVDQQSIETLVATIVTLIYFIYFAGSFYMFLYSSSRFRRTVKDRILWWKRPNQIHP